jgi:hypothetical protein
MMVQALFCDQCGKHLLKSAICSVVLVIILVGNAYVATSVGYPDPIRPLGTALLYVAFIFAVPPGLLFFCMQKLGIAWELRGRESFIESNPVLWIFCMVFYTLLIYFGFRLWHLFRQRHK